MVPTDRKWFAHLAIAATIVERLERLDLQFPKVEGRALAEMRKVRKALMASARAAANTNREAISAASAARCLQDVLLGGQDQGAGEYAKCAEPDCDCNTETPSPSKGTRSNRRAH